MFLIVALYRDFEGAKNIHVLKVLIWGFGGHWRVLTGIPHLDLDLDMDIGFGTPMFQNLALDLGFEGTKNIHDLYVLIWGFGWVWLFLTKFWHLDLVFDRTMVQILTLYLDFEGAKNIHVL